MNSTPFGILLRQHRGGMSLSALSRAAGVSRVCLSHVEKGRNLTIGRQYWPALIEALPTLTMAMLEDAATRSRSVTLRPWEYDGEQRARAESMAETIRRWEAFATSSQISHREP